MASSHSGIQKAAPGTKHCPAPPQRRYVLKRETLRWFMRPLPTQHHERQSVPPPPRSPSIDQSISSATGSLMPSTPTHSVLAGSVPLLLLCQLYLQLTCLPSAHRSSFPDSSGAELPITSSSEQLTCCRLPHSAALPSSGMAQPASGVPGEKTTISFMKTHPNWGRISNQGLEYHSWAIQHIHFQNALYSLIHLILITMYGVWVLLLLFPFYRGKK